MMPTTEISTDVKSIPTFTGVVNMRPLLTLGTDIGELTARHIKFEWASLFEGSV